MQNEEYSMTFNFLKSSYFHRCSANLSPSKKKRKVNILIFIIWNSHGHSDPEVISVRSHTSLRVFTALGQFREMVKSPQIMGMNKQKSSYSYFTYNLVSFKLKDHARLESCQFQGNQSILRDYGPKHPKLRAEILRRQI